MPRPLLLPSELISTLAAGNESRPFTVVPDRGKYGIEIPPRLPGSAVAFRAVRPRPDPHPDPYTDRSTHLSCDDGCVLSAATRTHHMVCPPRRRSTRLSRPPCQRTSIHLRWKSRRRARGNSAGPALRLQ